MKNLTIFYSLALLGLFTSPAYAYLDPGTGSILLQALIGGVAASVTVVSLYFQRIKAFFGGKSPSKTSDIK